LSPPKKKADSSEEPLSLPLLRPGNIDLLCLCGSVCLRHFLSVALSVFHLLYLLVLSLWLSDLPFVDSWYSVDLPPNSACILRYFHFD
jgi:hypothetical protein